MFDPRSSHHFFLIFFYFRRGRWVGWYQRQLFCTKKLSFTWFISKKGKLLLFSFSLFHPSTHNTTHFPPHIYPSEFKSSQAGFMAQLVAHWSNKPTVVGSSPTGTTFLLFFLSSRWVFLEEIMVVHGVK